MAIHETGRPLWQSKLDKMDNVHDRQDGEMFGRIVDVWARYHNIQIQSDAKYIAFGAGQAKPERGFANILNIPESNITLVDRQFSEKARDQFATTEIQTVEADMYTVLEKPTDTKYNVASAIGLEYVLANRNAMENLIQGLPKILEPDALVVIAPYHGDNLSDKWEQHSFKPIFPSEKEDSLQVFRYDPPKSIG